MIVVRRGYDVVISSWSSTVLSRATAAGVSNSSSYLWLSPVAVAPTTTAPEDFYSLSSWDSYSLSNTAGYGCCCGCCCFFVVYHKYTAIRTDCAL